MRRAVQQRAEKMDIQFGSASAALYGIREPVGRIILRRSFARNRAGMETLSLVEYRSP